jgi:glycosyltransferase involved in cell wall biosynthesis
MTAMRVALVALTTTGAAGDYVSALVTSMREGATTGVWIPTRPALTVASETHLIEKPRSRAGVASRETTAWLRHSALADEVYGWKPEVVHIVFGEGYPSAMKLARSVTARGTPVAATWHDPQPHGQPSDRIQHAIAALTMRSASGVHVHCESLVSDDVRSKALVAELPAFPCPSCSGPTTQPLRAEGTIVMVGRFAPYKGIDQACAAVAEYWTRGGQRHFVVVGQGRVPSSLRRLRDHWPSMVSIENAYISAERLHDVLSAAAICVMPYISGTQSALPWLARAHGAHLIATDVGCIGEVCRRVGGRVVDPGSIDELVNALLEPPSQWGDIARLPMPSFEALVDRLLEWYPTLSAS